MGAQLSILQVHFLDVTSTGIEDRHAKYEALVFMGRDNMSERYVLTG